MRCFVTGGTGFIGRVLVRLLVSRYGAESVTCLVFPEESELERTRRAALQALNVTTVVGDVRDWQPSPNDIPDFDLVFHLAATIDNLDRDHTTNDVGTENLIRVLGPKLAGKRFMFTSTTAGMDRKGRADGPLDETSACHPRTIYGKTKVRAERYVEEQRDRWGYTFSTLRLGLVYGPNYRQDGFFGLFTEWIRAGNILARIPWPGRTGIIFVEDVAQVLADLAVNEAAENELYCAVTESPPIAEIVRTIAVAAGSPNEPVPVPGWIWSALRAGITVPGLFRVLPGFLFGHFWRLNHMVDDGLWCDGSKMARLYGRPLVLMEDGMPRMLGSTPANLGSAVESPR